VAASLKGGPELKARLRAMRQEFKPMGRNWAQDTASTSNRTAPRGATGRLGRSHKMRNATQRMATVVAIFYGVFVNRGTKAHTIVAKNAPNLVFTAQGRTIFAKKVAHRGIKGTRYVDKAAQGALRKHVSVKALIDAWNRAA
jgi:hypothetical protein